MHNSLSKDRRNHLAKVTLDARATAERAAKAALENLAVHENEYRPHMKADARALRNRLRARGRALGDERGERSGIQTLGHLAEAVAYEQWHRLLFTRFLAENGLLHTDESFGNVPVTLAECEELASEAGAKDGFELACRFASRILPGVFRSDDPILELGLAPNHQVELRRLLDSLSAEIFRADDALGWTYQYWQATRKDEVNRSGVKIGADELPAVTQLFTEDYMVEFLLHNTIGAWWAGKRGPVSAGSEEEARQRLGLPARAGLCGVEWTYLRLVQDGTTRKWAPAAGTFPGWPRAAKDVTILDPCMGSGHFLVFALSILARLRMEEEAFDAKQAIAATVRDNMHGLELDPRCTQIGVFNLALAAWKLAGWQPIPAVCIACCGLAPQAKLTEWVALGGRDERLRRGMERFHALFSKAPTVGSLINPRIGGDILDAPLAELSPLLQSAIADERADESTHELAITARGIVTAAEILGTRFVLVATNVPFLGREKQDSLLRAFMDEAHKPSRADLACAMMERCVAFTQPQGTVAVVSPQYWLFLGRYKEFRRQWLQKASLILIARLGAGAFETITGEVVNTALSISANSLPRSNSFEVLDVTAGAGATGKASALTHMASERLAQASQLGNPDSVVGYASGGSSEGELLLRYAYCYQGLATSDNAQFLFNFWELPDIGGGWELFQMAPATTELVGGCSWCSRP